MKRNLSPLALAALGVVFGDIGTSPLYAFGLCFTGDFPAGVTRANIIGIVSLIFWALVIVVCVKYVTFMLRADNNGQGGTMALLALIIPKLRTGLPFALTGLTALALFGAAALYGDGAITPAISVISAIEGLDVWTKAAHPWIVPLSVAILLGLFLAQSRGTGRIGALFGPIMIIWFVAIAIAGAIAIAAHPGVLIALNPVYSWEFFLRNGLRSFLVMGAVVLCVTGVEALYADLAHFGRRPITIAWYVVVLPALALNYFGQGAVALMDPKTLENPFFSLYPHWAIIPMVLLATAATVIASQALITGVFSLTQQVVQLGYSPRFRVVHTSRHYVGQIYVPAVNAALAIVCILLVIAFRSSAALGGAYGLAVTMTMLTTSIIYFALTQQRWKWPLWLGGLLLALFLSWDVPFLVGNLPKIRSGGWVPLVVAVAIWMLFTTWNRGRRKLMQSLSSHTLPVDVFINEIQRTSTVSGTAFFLTPDPEGIPFVLQHQWLRTHIVYDTIVLLTVVTESRPFVAPSHRVDITQIAERLYRVKAHYGFMQQPNIDQILVACKHVKPDLDLSKPTYFLASPKISRAKSPDRLQSWQWSLYRWMIRNARPLTDSLGLPPNRTVEFGVDVPL
ncbi:MAG: KUP/HAK/KT family potassium transporter [Candidatus Eremiobacteraeota bacterium]|nr:KUP/HAK/KT family potassium transporter [Candidatus Eremiobacteraeota bacterium]MBV9737536.1 KUP/HAK/KT family potassium transporter [Candidatus Eremiobacteraeota bacterium]